MLKMNKKGFALVETLIVTVFVATIFTIMYTNFFPMFGEYERRETYDDVDSIYKTYLIKKMLENPSFREKPENNNLTFDATTHMKTLFSVDYKIVKETEENASLSNRDQEISGQCQKLMLNNSDYCIKALTTTKATKIYLTSYNITDLKKKVKNGNIRETDMDAQMQDYIDSLPYYRNNSSNCNYRNNSSNCNYRIIVQYAKEINKISENHKKIVYSFSTIGVNL